MIVDDKTNSISFSRPPKEVSHRSKEQSLILQSSDIQADANLYLLPSIKEKAEVLPIGWKFGFIQLQLTETNLGYYKGISSADGSMVVDRGSTTARGFDLCRDTDIIGEIWYTGAGSESAWEAKTAKTLPYTTPTFYFGDSPESSFALEYRNPKTKSLNRLTEVKLSLSFLTTLSMRSPDGVFTHLFHFTWGLNWHLRRSPGNKPIPDFSLLPESGGTYSSIRQGPPANQTHCGLLTDNVVRARHCKEGLTRGDMHPEIRADAVWKSFEKLK